MKKLMKQIVKFTVVGGSAFIIDFSILYVLTEFARISYLISAAISFSCSVIFNYTLSIKWVFVAKKNINKLHEFILFIILSIIGLFINELFMWIFVEKAHIFYMLSKIIATAVVMIYNFITRKLLIEQRKF